MRKVIMLAGLVMAIGACDFAGQAVDWSTGALATGIDEACERGMSPLGMEGRRRAVAEINARTEVGNHTPSDCDGDGLPDFEIDANGSPLPPTS